MPSSNDTDDFLLEVELAQSSRLHISTNSYLKRKEQLKRWNESDTNREPVDRKHTDSRINFHDQCVFLAACSSSDLDEVEELLKKGADVNSANIDGLTALHQACIDGNMEVVEFLLRKGANVNHGDNEGWTPLHATASCGYIDIAKFLVEKGAKLNIVNNDGDLPLDIANNEDMDVMENFLRQEMLRQNIDAAKARSEEERTLLLDSKKCLDENLDANFAHPVTKATPLHIAAAKGYHDVMKILFQTNAKVDARDADEWTPFLAAAHWGQNESCELLAEQGCDFKAQTKAGRDVFDICDENLLKFIRNLIERHTAKRKKAEEAKKEENVVSPVAATVVEKTNVDELISPNVVPPMKAIISEMPHIVATEPAPKKDLRRSSSVSRRGSEEKNLIHQLDTSMDRIGLFPTPDVAPGAEKDAAKSVNANIEKIGKNDACKGTTQYSSMPWVRSKQEAAAAAAVAANNGKVQNEVCDNNEKNLAAVANVINKDDKSESSSSSNQSSNKRWWKRLGSSTFDKNLKSKESSEWFTPTASAAGKPADQAFIATTKQPKDESESQRKLHAKKVRENRRSTQGVSMEDIQNAEFTLRRNEDASLTITSMGPTTDATVSTTITSTVAKPKLNIPIVDTVSSADSQGRISTPEVVATLPAFKSKSPKKFQQTAEVNDDEVSQSPSAVQRRRRPKRRSTGIANVDIKVDADQNVHVTEKCTDESISSSLTGGNDDSDVESSNINGIVNNNEKGEPKSVDRLQNLRQEANAVGGVSLSSSRYDTRRAQSEVAQSETQQKSTTKECDLDYKKLYEAASAEIERLNKQLRSKDEQIKVLKESGLSGLSNGSAATEKERMLRKRVMEMEDKMKENEQLRLDNQRLKDENGALIRVISKLSK